MIRINLFPHREAARRRRREVFYFSLGLSALSGALVAGAFYAVQATQAASQRARNDALRGAIGRLDGQIKDIANLHQEIARLRARQQAVQDLQADRNMPVHLLSELTRQLPEGVYLSSLRQDQQTIALQGVAQSNERVSELLRNLDHHSVWFARPELVEITAGSVTLGARDPRRVANFNIRVQVRRAGEAAALATPKPPAPTATGGV